tara:strand:- start:1354 stop:3786 length:2433 start_codon:yes stop_codon:yes gene_type:complete
VSQTNNFLFESLNKEQIQAVSHLNGPLLVVAGAGSGKTKALTHRIANLIQNHSVNPRNILAVTFTNKAAKEMKERVEIILAREVCKNRYVDKTWATISKSEQNILREEVYKEKLKDLWIGTFHSLFSKLLRLDIEKYKHPEGLKWKKTFSIYDEKDSEKLIKEIINEDLKITEQIKQELDIKPRKIKYKISNAKNKCLSSKQLAEKAKNEEEKIIAEIYKKYIESLSKNNALDFDDLILFPVLLLRQNDLVRDLWHRKFRHILIDEYQDTNQTQYELIKLITTNKNYKNESINWEDRSIFVVGDADQSIYSFRAADFTILMNFRKDFKNDSELSEVPMVKLEENYRSTSNILGAANELIKSNTDRIDKVLKATRGDGEKVKIICCDDAKEEAETVINKIETLSSLSEKRIWSNFAILYRTRAQSRLFETELSKKKIPFRLFGLRFYDRKEVKDIIAYLRILVNNEDDGSLYRVINIPRRGIGDKTLDKIKQHAEDNRISAIDLIRNKNLLKDIFPKPNKGVDKFVQLMDELSFYEDFGPSKTIQLILEKSGYWEELKKSSDHEDKERIDNLNELINAAIQYEEESEVGTIEDYLASTALSTDTQTKDKQDKTNSVSLLTLHNSKGLEFKNVFITGLEDGLFPSSNSSNTPSEIEEERRLCYVGLTRGKDRVFLTHARDRTSWGDDQSRYRYPSMFLEEIPSKYSEKEEPRRSGLARARNGPERLTRTDRIESINPIQSSYNAIRKTYAGPSKGEKWSVGDKVHHAQFGIGVIERISGKGAKITLIVKFANLVGKSKVLDPWLAPIKPFGK